MLKPSVVYESPKVNKNFVSPHVSLADAEPIAATIDSADSKEEAFQNSPFILHSLRTDARS